MTTEQEKNIEIIVKSLNKYGISNPFLQAGILATVSKETDFVPKSESLYYSTPEGLRQTYPSSFPTVESAKPFIKNSELVANKVYGGKYGNTADGDGFKYRGRGFHQLTFKGNYEKYGRLIGVDLVNNPDLLNNPQIAADVLAVFFAESLKNAIKSGQIKNYGVNNLNEVKDTITGTRIAVQTNAGWGNKIDNKVETSALQKALSNVDTLYSYTRKAITPIKQKTDGNPLAVVLIAVGLISLAYVGFNHEKFF